MADIIIPNQLEMQKIAGVSATYQSVSYETTYSQAPIVVCTYNLASSASLPAQVRVNNVTTTSFNVKVQGAAGAPTAGDVYCTISLPGTFTSPVPYIAGSVTSDFTQDNNSWFALNQENVSPSAATISSLGLTNANVTVIGQVMTENDAGFVTFWSHACSTNAANTNNRGTPPTASSICVGKHTGQINTISGANPGVGHTTETLGYIIGVANTYTLATGHLQIGAGADIVKGVRDTPPYVYTLDASLSYPLATSSQTSEAGGNGGWSVFYGANPISTVLNLAIDETRVTDRKHTTEPHDYWAFFPAAIIVNNRKTAQVIEDPINGTSNPKMIPNSIINYEINVTNESEAEAGIIDANSMVITDAIQDNLRLYIGTTNPAYTMGFTEGAAPNQSGLTPINYAGPSSTSDDVEFSAFTSGNDWTHTPVDADSDGFEDTNATKRIRYRLKGNINDTSTGNTPTFIINFSAILNT